MKKFSYLLLFILYSCTSHSQLEVIANLPKKLREVSGNQIVANSNLIWMHNDAGNSPIIYGVSTTGNIVRKVVLNALNTDWEDITSDDEGNLYIGDFGNNDLGRKELNIYKISNYELLTKEQITPTRITFEYPNMDNEEMRYNAEAFFYFHNNFYIFTKSSPKQNVGESLLFKVVVSKEKQTAIYMGKYRFCSGNSCRITAATISPNKKEVVLLTHQELFVFSNFTDDHFFGGTLNTIKLINNTQKEGLCFKSDNKLYITDERTKNKGGNLYLYAFKK